MRVRTAVDDKDGTLINVLGGDKTDFRNLASIFWLDRVETDPSSNSDKKFRIMAFVKKDSQEAVYIARNEKVATGKGSIQVIAEKEDALELSLDDGVTIEEWMQSYRPCLMRTADGGYLGYNRDSNLMEYFPSDEKCEAGEFELKRWYQLTGGVFKSPSPEPPLMI